MGSKVGFIIIITFLVIISVPLITQLDMYYHERSRDIIGINEVVIQVGIAFTFILCMGKNSSM